MAPHMSRAVIQPLVLGLPPPTKPKPTVTTASTVVEPRPVRAGVSWPSSVLIWTQSNYSEGWENISTYSTYSTTTYQPE